jgi:hypothetical protein
MVAVLWGVLSQSDVGDRNPKISGECVVAEFPEKLLRVVLRGNGGSFLSVHGGPVLRVLCVFWGVFAGRWGRRKRERGA